MLKPHMHAIKLANMLANNLKQEMTHDQYEFFRETVNSQQMYEIKDVGDDGVVYRYNDSGKTYYQALWFVNVRGEGHVSIHTAIGFCTPFEALNELVDIMKTDSQDEQDDAVEAA